MANVMQSDKSSSENLQLFVDTIQDEDLKAIITTHSPNILSIGADQDPDRKKRDAFFDAIQSLIDQRMKASL